MQLEMPRLLGARPDQSGDYFWGSARPSEGFNVGFGESRSGRNLASTGGGRGDEGEFAFGWGGGDGH